MQCPPGYLKIPVLTAEYIAQNIFYQSTSESFRKKEKKQNWKNQQLGAI